MRELAAFQKGTMKRQRRKAANKAAKINCFVYPIMLRARYRDVYYNS